MAWKAVSSIVKFIGSVSWKTSKEISDDQKSQIKELLKPHYYIIVARRSNHLSTYFIDIANFFLTGKWGYYSHVLMNVEDEVGSDNDFRLIEALGTGVQYSAFENVFNVQGVALLKPKHMTIDSWTAVLDRAKSSLGTPYDTLFDLTSSEKMSCVELVRTALMAEPNYAQNFAHFEKMIKEDKNLTPHMFYMCDDFEVVYEARV